MVAGDPRHLHLWMVEGENGNWNRIDFDKPGETEKCERYMLDIFETSAAENFKDLDMVQLHCQVRKVKGEYMFCPKPCTRRLKN